ncbi:MAG: transcriptional regulator [Rubrivivax sp.]|nr:transcriptional regulator [Pyrinomonadaceae bacterium]
MARQNALAKEKQPKAGAQSSPQELGAEQRRRASKPNEGPAAAAELDRLIHERIRLAIVSALAVNESLTFNDLEQLLNTTDGTLSVHARKLEDAQYITCNKFFDGRTPKTEYKLTAAGRRALERYLGHMESVIRAARGG